jgi:hypothetical protein
VSSVALVVTEVPVCEIAMTVAAAAVAAAAAAAFWHAVRYTAVVSRLLSTAAKLSHGGSPLMQRSQ